MHWPWSYGAFQSWPATSDHSHHHPFCCIWTFVAEPDLQKIVTTKDAKQLPMIELCNGVLPGNSDIKPLEDRPVTAHWLVLLHSQQTCISLMFQNTWHWHNFGIVWKWSPILELTQARKRRGVRMTRRRGARVNNPTHLFRSRGRGFPSKGGRVVVSSTILLWMISALRF